MTREQFKENIRKLEAIEDIADKLTDIHIEILDCEELFYAEEIFFDWVKDDFGENGKDLVSWWMYEDVEKKIYESDGKETNLENIDDLYSYLEAHYCTYG